MRRHEALRTCLAAYEGVPVQRILPAVSGRVVPAAGRRPAALRTTFSVQGGEPWQRIVPELEPPFAVVDLTGLDRAAREAEAIRIATVEADTPPFDLEHGPLLRVQVLRMQPSELVVVLAIHHIVFDGWSLDVVLREMAELYEAIATGGAPTLAPLPLQYRDYARWQRDWLRGDGLASGSPTGGLSWRRPRCWSCRRTGRGAPCRRAVARASRSGCRPSSAPRSCSSRAART